MDSWPFKPMSIGAILDRSFQFYRNHLRQLFILSLVFLGPFLLLLHSSIYNFSQMPFLPDLHTNSSLNYFKFLTIDQAGGYNTRFLQMYMSLLIIYLFAYPFLQTSIVFMVRSFVQGEAPVMNDLFRNPFRRFWAVLGSTFGFMLAMIGVSILMSVGLLIISLLGVAANETGSKILASIIIALTSLFSICIMGSFAIRWWFYLPTAAFEQTNPGLGKSWELTRGNFWRLAAIFFIVTAITYIVGTVFRYVFLFLPGLSLLGQLLVMLVYLITAPVIMVTYAFTYFDLKARKEGGDLQEMIAANLPQPEAESGERLEIKMEG